MTAPEPSSPDNERQEQGLWLWHGEAPAQGEALPPIQPLPRIKRMTHLFVSVAQRSMRLALNGPALIGQCPCRELSDYDLCHWIDSE